MAGQRTRLRFGAVSAEVLLEKTSTKPRAAQHETRRVLAEPVPVPPGITAGRDATIETGTDPFGDPVAAPVAWRNDTPEHDATVDTPDGPMVVEHKTTASRGPLATEVHEGEVAHLPPGLLGPMGDPAWPTKVDADFEAEGELEGERRDDLAEPRSAPVPEADAAGGSGSRVERQAAGIAPPAPAPTYVPPATRVEQGVHLETGEWVDLTAQLTEVDERTRVDGLEVVRTIPASSYASERVREAHYVSGVEPGTFKVLALLWRALRSERMAAEVRWTKRTAQASGIILARGDTERPKRYPPHLLLLELEWASQVKPAPPRARGPIMAEVGVDEVVAAVELVRSFAAPAPRVELRDERLAKRAELLEFAREGRLGEYVAPAEPMPADVADDAEDLPAALALAAAWNREHAPA